MSIGTLIEKIAAKHRDRQKVQGTDYPTLVRQLADSVEPEAELIERMLFEAGKSFDDLRVDAELLQRRRQWRAQYDGLPEISAERNRIESEMAAADRELEAVEKRHYDTVMPLSMELSHLRQVTSEGEDARRRLWETCCDPELVDQLKEVLSRIQHASREESELADATSQWRERMRREQAAAGAAKQMIDGEPDVKKHLAWAKESEKKLAKCEAELSKLRKKIAELKRREEQIREQMLVP
jgi:hypothetical protein